MTPENFSKNLGEILQIQGMSQIELSEMSGLSQALISQIINGKRDPSLSTICKILQVLPCTFEKLVNK